MVNVDPYVLGGIILAIIGSIAGIIRFFVKLETKVKYLEKQIEENPIFVAFKQFERDAAIKIFDDYLKNRLEKKNWLILHQKKQYEDKNLLKNLG